MEKNVDLAIRVRDEASKKLGLFADNLTAMQQKIAKSIKQTDFGFSTQLQQRLEGLERIRDSITAKANEQRIGQHPDFLNALLPPNFSEQLRDRMEKANTTVDMGMKKIIGSIMGRGTVYGLAALAVIKSIDMITDAHRRLRESDKTTVDYINVWAESIPVFGRVSRSLRELATELSGVYEAQELAAKKNKLTDHIQDLSVGYYRRAELRNAPNDKERERILAKQAYDDQLEKNRSSKEYIEILKERKTVEEKIKKLENEMQQGAYGPGYMGVPTKGAGASYITQEIVRLQDKLKNDLSFGNINGLDAKALKEYQDVLAKIESKPFEDLNTQLRGQIDTWGMNNAQMTVYKAQLAGIKGEQLEQVRIMVEKLQMMDDTKKKQEELAAAEKKRNEEEAAANKRKLDEMKSFSDRVKEMIRTPAQEFEEVQKKLQESLDKGFINQQEYFLARNKFAKDIFGTSSRSGGGDMSAKAWSPFESRYMTTAPAGREDNTIKVAKNIEQTNKILGQIAKNTQPPKVEPASNNEITIIDL
jgi:hypothetical protein